MEGYLGRLTDRTWNDLISNSELENDGLLDTGANSTLDFLTEDNQLVNSEGRAGLVKGLFGAGITAGVFALGGPVTAAIAGSGLLGVLRGRGGTNLFRTMGIISPNSDDDLPGFDEVSFKAQTYMRTVWDLFQMCARLLPNYIVAVRPFEDRSTVFYGKPHWLYTSGVVPITTGFPGQEKAEELGIIAPQIKQPDQDLISILDKIFSRSDSNNDKISEKLDIIIQFNQKYFTSRRTLQIMYPLKDDTIYIHRPYDIIYANKNCMFMIYQILKSKYFTDYMESKQKEKPVMFKFLCKKYFYDYLSTIFVFKEF